MKGKEKYQRHQEAEFFEDGGLLVFLGHGVELEDFNNGRVANKTSSQKKAMTGSIGLHQDLSRVLLYKTVHLCKIYPHLGAKMFNNSKHNP